MTSLTYAREVYEDGRMEGEAKGREEGREEGLAKGKIQSILDLLAELGDIPESLRQKISREENLETLSRWVKLAAKAESVADFEEKMSNA